MINFHSWTGSSRRWTWREDEHFLFHSPRSWGMYKFQLAGKWSESEKMSCYATLENLYEPKMDMILTISFKIAVETCLVSYFADELYQLCMVYVFHCHEMRLRCFFTEQNSWENFKMPGEFLKNSIYNIVDSQVKIFSCVLILVANEKIIERKVGYGYFLISQHFILQLLIFFQTMMYCILWHHLKHFFLHSHYIT